MPIAPQLVMPDLFPDPLAPLRRRIDAVDDELLRLLNDRARLVAEVGEVKRRTRGEGPFYVASRERAIVERLAAGNEGPFPTEALRPVFQEIFSACLALEKALRIAYLGPEATWTHAAVSHQFGLSAQALPMGTIEAVFAEVERGGADFGVVPVENSTEGMVGSTLDVFLDSALKISAEIVLPVDHALLLHPGADPGQVQRVYSHPQALAQCRRWLAAELPHAACVETGSTAEAARMAREDVHGAALASELAAKLYGLTVARRRVQDQARNFTRFLVLGARQAEPTGRDRCSLLLILQDGPGALLRLLQPLAARGLNLSRIESHPTRRRPWEYAFFLDLDGHPADPPVAAALEELQGLSASFRLLGAYPKAEPASPGRAA
ncbi:MAG TPA: prephenate dehydratase [Holophagaceae bacterium]|nr:prephenate dehydratase [Holophagaceae bacterium]